MIQNFALKTLEFFFKKNYCKGKTITSRQHCSQHLASDEYKQQREEV
jgi:hypothetical protein